MQILAACHIHSNWSYDGSWTLEALSERFSARGYRVLMMTEHDRGFSEGRLSEFREACSKASNDRILVVPGIEYSDAENRVHVLVWGKIRFLGEGLHTSSMLDAAWKSGGLAVLAHPSRRDAWKSFQPDWAEKLLGIEVWNRKYDGWAPGNSAPELLKKASAVPFVGLDFHTVRQSFPLGMLLDVPSEVTEESVLDAMRSRKCQPQAFGVSLKDQTVKRITPVLRMFEMGRMRAASLLKRKRPVAKK